MSEPSTPIDVYKAIIDQLVDETRQYGPSCHVAESGIYSNAPDHREYNSFIATLSEQQRLLLARMLEETRHGAIHDVLATLTWWLDCREVGITYQGAEMPTQLSGMGLHGDYVGRYQGWKWPGKKKRSK